MHAIRRGDGLDRLFRPGDHGCHFYRSADEVGEVLIPYFKAGLERNEACIWVTGPSFGKERAVSGMRTAMSDFDRRAAVGQIQFIGEETWEEMEGLGAAEKAHRFLLLKDEALARGYLGLRAGGNAPLLEERGREWDDFLAYERAVTDAFKGQPAMALCSYSIDGCTAARVVDATHCHGFGLAKRHDRWGLVEVRSHGDEPWRVEGGRQGPSMVSAWKGSLRRLVEDQLAMFMAADPERIVLKGGNVGLSRSQAAVLGVLLSELTTNAARHGALSSPRGRVVVQWVVVANGSRRLRIKWTESGLSKLAIPDKVGRGARLMASLAENCVRVFTSTGMTCTFELGL